MRLNKDTSEPASKELVHHHEEPTSQIVRAVTDAANDAMFGMKEMTVTAEHTMQEICEYFGIHPFHHNFFGNLVGTNLVFYKTQNGGHLEIQREGTSRHTSFPVQLVA